MGKRQDIAELQSAIFQLEKRVYDLENNGDSDDDDDDGTVPERPAKRVKCHDCKEDHAQRNLCWGTQCAPCAIFDFDEQRCELWRAIYRLTHFVRDNVPHTGAFVPCDCENCERVCEPVKFDSAHQV